MRGTEAAAAPPRVGRAPKWDLLIAAIFGAILSYIWRIQDVYPILRAIEYPSLVSLAVLGLYLTSASGRRKLGKADSKVLRAATVVFFFAVLSGPFSLAKGMTFWFIVSDFAKTFVLMLIIAAAIRHVEDARRLTLAVVLGAFAYSFYVDTKVTMGMGGRLGNLIMYDANDLGALLIFTIPLTLFFVFRGRAWWSRLLAGGALLLFLRVIIKSGSRGAFLGLIGLALYFLFGLKAVKARTRILVVAGGVAVMMLVGSQTYWDMMRTLLNPTEDYNWSTGDAEGSGRMDLWKRGMGYMLSDPITGVGGRAFPVAEGTISSIAWRQDVGIGVKWSAAHNSFVQVGAETGVGGLLGLLAALWLTFKGSREIGRGYRRSGDRHLADASWLGYAIGGSMVGFFVAGSFVSHAYLPHIYILFGTLAGLQKVLPDGKAARRRARVAGRAAPPRAPAGRPGHRSAAPVSP